MNLKHEEEKKKFEIKIEDLNSQISLLKSQLVEADSVTKSAWTALKSAVEELTVLLETKVNTNNTAFATIPNWK